MVLFPVIATVVSAAFALLLFQQFGRGRRVQQLAWAIAMTMFGTASLAVVIGTTQGWDPFVFRLYWLFGALLNVPFLAFGSVALFEKKAVTIGAAAALAIGSLFAVVRVLTGHINRAAFSGSALTAPRGSEAWTTDLGVHNLPYLYSIPAYLLVVAIAVVTARRHRESQQRIRANWLIAAGVTVVAIGSNLARYGRGAVFGIALALGVSVMFMGFMLASRPEKRTIAPATEEPA